MVCDDLTERPRLQRVVARLLAGNPVATMLGARPVGKTMLAHAFVARLHRPTGIRDLDRRWLRGGLPRCFGASHHVMRRYLDALRARGPAARAPARHRRRHEELSLAPKIQAVAAERILHDLDPMQR